MAISKSKDQRTMEQVDKIHEMKHEQSKGLDKLPTVTANRNKAYQIRTDESEGYVHLLTRQIHPQPNKTNAVIDSIQIIHKDEFDRKIEQNAFQLYDEVEVIHDPRDGSPSEYKIKTLMNATPAKETANANRQDNSQLRDRQKQLADKQKELDAREKAIADREAALTEKK